MTSQSLISIYYALTYPYLTYGCVLWGNYEAPLSQLVRLQIKVVRIINNVPLCDHITPHYVNLGVIKLPDIVKLYTCKLFYDHPISKKSLNLNLSLVSEQHNYATRSASLQHLKLENYLKKHFTSFILLSIDNSNLIYFYTMRLLFILK